MNELRQHIGHFLGASVINLALTLLLTWGPFKVFSGSKMPRAAAVVISCVIVAGGLALLTVIGGELTSHNAYQTIWVGFWLVLGLLFWGKDKPAANQLPADNL